MSLVKEKECFNIKDISKAHAVARNILESLREVIDNENEVGAVFSVFQKLSEDPDANVRSEVMEQVPHVAVFCNEFSLYEHVISQQLAPIIVQHFTDSNDQVRKTSHAALLVLLEQGLVDKVCPVLFQLAEPDSFDNWRTDAVALMSRLALLVGRELTLRLFLDSFSTLCTDALFHVRKACATNFGDFCNVVGVDITEKFLLQKFYYLCEDGVWDVRKACSEVFMSVACACSLETRRQDLASVFLSLLTDPSRWVKMSAFQCLGPFISTFADPSITGLYYKDDGIIYDETKIIYVKDKNIDQISPICSALEENPAETKLCSNISGINQSADSDIQSSTLDDVIIIDNSEKVDMNLSNEKSETTVPMDLSLTADCAEKCVFDGVNSTGSEESIEERKAGYNDFKTDMPDSSSQPSSSEFCDNKFNPSLSIENKDGHFHVHLDQNLQMFESINYWRVPIPQIELDIDLVEGLHAKVHVRAKVHDEQHHKIYASDLDVNVKENEVDGLATNLQYADISGRCDVKFQSLSNDPETNRRLEKVLNSDVDSAIGTSPGVSSPLAVLSPDIIVSHQDIVPQDLLYHFICMTDPCCAQTIGTDITRHCAFSFPAVAFTLGRSNWNCLRGTYEALASDLQWKVRHTLASSIHQLAVILGEEIVAKDLVSKFNDFIKDLDEVRIGILCHLADFLKFLKPELRQEYLPKLPHFLKSDNEKTWRYRYELTQQILLIPSLYSPTEVKIYILPIALCLVTDKVSEVRKHSNQAMAVVIKRLSEDEDLVRPVLRDLADQLSRSRRWTRRQTYACLCRSFLQHNSIPNELFVTELLPHFLNLCRDAVPNVRIVVAQCLSQEILQCDFVSDSSIEYNELLIQATETLRNDSDSDVRYFANSNSFHERTPAATP
ncbi:Serine/threonine-protein phosphatase 4 regulatory subunit 1 [Nymphon striatum]|nr:Serine/threonine-protein phosphatase 4 regulatory subunit 1 [Nymphon striatum]